MPSFCLSAIIETEQGKLSPDVTHVPYNSAFANIILNSIKDFRYLWLPSSRSRRADLARRLSRLGVDDVQS